jgi:hypothetical protein
MSLNYFQVLTLLVSCTSLVISFRVQRQQLRLQKAQEELAKLQIAERRVQVVAVVGDRLVKLRPFGTDQGVNNLTIYFPQALAIAPIAVAAPDLDVAIDRIAPRVKNFWDACTPPREGHALVRPTASIPVALEIHGYTKGVTVMTRAFYDLIGQYLMRPDGVSEFSLRTLVLNNYLLPTQNTVIALEEAFRDVVSAVHTSS